MKIDIKAAERTSNIPQHNATAMEIDSDGMQHIMSLLTNLYRDPETAVIREYYTNAVDAHIEAGMSVPVRVTLPSWDDPVYTVQDFGVGMSERDIKDVYSKYGASTKRNSNTQSGAFGLGCKSAFAIANQFTVVSVKAGMKCTTLFSMVVNGTYESITVSNVETSAPNGTIVKVPIKDSPSRFNQKAHNFFRFSVPGLVEVDGVTPEYAPDLCRKIENPDNPSMDLRLQSKGWGESYVIMGNIPYALSVSEIETSLSRLKVEHRAGLVRMAKYITVGIGDVDLTPNREGLMFTEKTIKVLDDHMSFLSIDLKEIAVKDLDDATSMRDYFDRRSNWTSIVSIPQMFRGKVVPDFIVLDKEFRQITRNSWGGTGHAVGDTLCMNRSPEKEFVVTGYSAEKYKKVNNLIGPFMIAKGLTSAEFIITDSADILTNEWVQMIDSFTFISGDDLIEIGKEQRKKDRQAASQLNGTADRPKISYPVLSVSEGTVTWITHSEIDQNAAFIGVNDFESYQFSAWLREIYRHKTEYVAAKSLIRCFELCTDHDEIVLLGGGRTEKALLQRVKNAKNISPEVKKKLSSLPNPVTDELIRYHTIKHSFWSRLLLTNHFAPLIQDILDPDLREISEAPKALKDTYVAVDNTRNAVNFFGQGTLPRLETDDKITDKLDQKYPLLINANTYSLSRTTTAHMVKYINMVHKETAEV